ncbi:MAG: transposase [Ignavibacteriae bacterium]|nr:MAG: transposase [Ignavibacteriota bacterium]
MLLVSDIREKLLSHIKSNAKQKEIILTSLNGCQDHIHALILLKADQTISKVVQLLKGESSHWLNSEKLLPDYFEWQNDYYAVSVNEYGVEQVKRYISNQEEPHRIKSFSEECTELFRENSLKDEG